MTNNNKLEFNRLIYPGLSLKEILEAEEISVLELANKINIDKKYIYKIIELKIYYSIGGFFCLKLFFFY